MPPAKVELFEANLREPEVTQLQWSDERLAAIKEQLRLSIRSMKAYLVDPAANVGAIADFEKTEDLRICKWCNFRVVCRPELARWPGESSGGRRRRPAGSRGSRAGGRRRRPAGSRGSREGGGAPFSK